MEDRDAKKEVKINKLALEDALEEQPDLFLDWAMEHAEAINERNALKYELDEKIKPRFELEIRKDPKKFGLEKVTENAIMSTIFLQDEYSKASEKLMEATNRMNKLLAVREAFDHRRSSLKYLVELWTQNYYGQNVGRDKSSVRKEETKVTNKSSEEHRKKAEEGMRNRRSRG